MINITPDCNISERGIRKNDILDDFPSWKSFFRERFSHWINVASRGGWSLHGYTVYEGKTPLFTVTQKGDIIIHEE